MGNRNPDRNGLRRTYTLRRMEIGIAVGQAITRLSKRRDLAPAKAFAAVLETLRLSGMAGRGFSRRTLQRHWVAEIRRLRQTLRVRYLSPQVRHKARMLAAFREARESADDGNPE
jgi:hypothetical protein